MTALSRTPRTGLILAFLLGAVLWLAVDIVYVAWRVDWIAQSDSRGYWFVANNLGAFWSPVTIGFPLIWRLLHMAFPQAPPNTVGQGVSMLTFAAMAPVVLSIYRSLNVRYVWRAMLLTIAFPIVGVTYSIPPRANSLLRLLAFVAILAYILDRRTLLVVTLSILPLLHRAILPFVGVLFLVGLWERRLRPWMLLPTALPTLLYAAAGSLATDDWRWYLSWNPIWTRALGLPVADGLLGTVVLGLRGSVRNLVQGVIILAYWLAALFLLLSRIWQGYLFTLALIIPVLFLGLVQPASEIWSMVTYTTYLSIPLIIYLQERHERWLANNLLWTVVLALCLLSQLVWANFQAGILGLR